jgi:hypothetical protein
MAGTERPAQGRKSQEPAYPAKKNKKTANLREKYPVFKTGGNCQPQGGERCLVLKNGKKLPTCRERYQVSKKIRETANFM